MAKILEMPKLSPTMDEGQLTTWHKKEGDAVAVDDLLAEVETDKATMEFRSFDKGTLLKLLVPPGQSVKLGQPVAILGNPGEDVSKLVSRGDRDRDPRPRLQPRPRPRLRPRPAAATATATPAAPAAAASTTNHTAPPHAQPTAACRASPYVRKIARERGIDLGGVAGTGPRGRIVARDLESLPSPPRIAAAHALAPARRRRRGSPALDDAQDHRASPHRVEADCPALLPVHRRRRRSRLPPARADQRRPLRDRAA